MRKINKIKNLSGLLDLASIPQYQNGGETVVERTLPEVEVYGDQLRRDMQRTGLTYDELSNLNYGAQRQSQIQKREEGVKELAYNAPVTGDVLSLYDVGKDVYSGNYGKAALGAGLFFLPNIIERPLKNVVRKIGKKFTIDKRLQRAINTAADVTDNKQKILDEFKVNRRQYREDIFKELSKPYVKAYDDSLKDELLQRFKDAKEKYLTNTTLQDALTGEYYSNLDQPSKDLFLKLYQEDPQYLLFAIANDLPINSKDTVKRFAKKQESSVRGAFIPNTYSYDDVYSTITKTHGERIGGDRMFSRNGLYISNSKTIQDRFSRKLKDDQVGWAAKAELSTNYLPDENKSIPDQLYDLRRRYIDYDIITDADKVFFKYPVPHKYLSLQELYDLGYIGLEGRYVRHNGQKLPVYERTMFHPNDEVSVIDITDFQASDDIENIHGRWGKNAVGANYTDKEFVHRSPGGFKDFLGYYRILNKALDRMQVLDKLEDSDWGELGEKIDNAYISLYQNLMDNYKTSKKRLDSLKSLQNKRNNVLQNTKKYTNKINKILSPAIIGLTLYNTGLEQSDQNKDVNRLIKQRQKIKDRTDYIKSHYDYNYAEGGIHIKKKNRGKFTKSAKQRGMGVQEYARKVVNDPNATTLQKRRAQFAINAKKFKH